MSQAPNHHEVTQLLLAAGAGGTSGQQAAAELLPLVYAELRKLAAARMAKEQGGGAGFTLQPTALVHEAYMRLVGPGDVMWNGRGHFFGAAALAMRRILVERARSRMGARGKRVDLEMQDLAAEPEAADLIAVDDALKKLEAHDKRKYDVVMLRYFAGLSIEDTAAAIGVSPATVKTDWTFARAWLKREMSAAESDSSTEESP
ncbi:MAG: ECF-type sigma factor [Planctomycetota bacterium]